MRYILLCVDKSHKILSEKEGEASIACWAKGRPIILGGSALAPHYISAIKPIKEWWEQQQSIAAQDGKYFCEYGHFHPHSERCTCSNVRQSLLASSASQLPSGSNLSLPSDARH